MTSPLLDLFYQLRDEEGFSLSIEQYNRVNNYLLQKCANEANINEIENHSLNNSQLKRLCQALWVKSFEQKQKFNQAWEQMLQLHQEIDLEINQEKIIDQKNNDNLQINTDKYPGEITPVSEAKNQAPLPPSSSPPSPSPPQLTAKDSQIGTAIETRKRWNSFPKNNPDYYPIGTAKLQESWQQLHPLPVQSPRREWDIKSTVIEAAKQGFFQRIIYKKKQLYRREIVIFIDRSDSMIPFAGFGRILINSWQDASAYYFDNVITEEILISEKG